MPTASTRHTTTETPDVKQWPDDVTEARPDDTATWQRQQAIKAASGSMPGLWPPGWYEQYKQQDWPFDC